MNDKWNKTGDEYWEGVWYAILDTSRQVAIFEIAAQLEVSQQFLWADEVFDELKLLAEDHSLVF